MKTEVYKEKFRRDACGGLCDKVKSEQQKATHFSTLAFILLKILSIDITIKLGITTKLKVMYFLITSFELCFTYV